MYVQPYLFFEGRCEDALEFYKTTIGARVEMLMKYKESPDPNTSKMIPPQNMDKVMHSSFWVGDSMLMASDGMCSGSPKISGVSLTITAKDAAEADRLFNGLSDGGQVQMPLSETFFSPRFGMVADKFGVSWMVIVEKK